MQHLYHYSIPGIEALQRKVSKIFKFSILSEIVHRTWDEKQPLKEDQTNGTVGKSNIICSIFLTLPTTVVMLFRYFTLIHREGLS